jgi:hypothetical protein
VTLLSTSNAFDHQGARKELDNKEGKKFNIDTFQRREVDYRELHGLY